MACIGVGSAQNRRVESLADRLTHRDTTREAGGSGVMCVCNAFIQLSCPPPPRQGAEPDSSRAKEAERNSAAQQQRERGTAVPCIRTNSTQLTGDDSTTRLP